MPGIGIASGNQWAFNSVLIEFYKGILRLKRSIREGLTGYWPMNEPLWNGTTPVVDDSVNGNNGIAQGGAQIIPWFLGRAGDFTTHNTDAIFVDTITGVVSGSTGTIMCKVRHDADNGDFMYLFNLSPIGSTFITTGIIFGMDLRSGGTGSDWWRISAWVDGVVQWDWHGPGGLTPNVDRVIEISHNGTTPTFYQNNVDITSSGAATFITSTDKTVWMDDFAGATTPPDAITLGAARSTGTIIDALNGKMQNIVILKRVLTASERTAFINSSFGIHIEDMRGLPTSSPVATSPQMAIDQNTFDAVVAILFQLILEGSASILFQYNLSDGGFNGSFLTPAQLLAALVSQPIVDHEDSIQFMAQFNSNGNDDAGILLPQTKAEAEGISGGGSQAAIADVRLGTTYNDGALTGTLAVPADADVRSGIAVDAGAGTAGIPGAEDVRVGVDTDATVGTAAIPIADNVRLNVPTDDTVGNYVPANEDRHALGDSYGSNGTEFTGTKALTSFQLPVDVILEDEENLVFEGCE